MWIDSHCHPHLNVELGSASLERAWNNGVSAAICVGCDFETSLAAAELATQDPTRVFASLGLHPHDANKGVETIRPLLSRHNWVAIGECGLDYFYEHSDRAAQREAFVQQIQLASESDLALIIHSRDAWDDTFAILDECGTPARTVFHCFTGGPREAELALERGALLSFSGIVTFKNATETQQAAKITPGEKILVETDAPYLAPVPHRGKTNEPAWVSAVGEYVADLREESREEFAATTRSNTVAMFRLPQELA